MKIRLDYPDNKMLVDKFNNVVNDYKQLRELKSLINVDFEGIDNNTIEIIILSANSLCSKYNEEFNFIGKCNIDIEAFGNTLDLENEVLNKVADKILDGLKSVKESMSDFSKRLSIAIKSKPLVDISKKIDGLPVKSVVIEKSELGFINRSFDAYSKARDITSLNELFKELKTDDVKSQTRELMSLLDYLSTLDVKDKTMKELKEELLKHCVVNDIDKHSYNVINNNDFKIPKAIYGLKNEIKNKDTFIIASACTNKHYRFTLVGVVAKTLGQKLMNITDLSDSYMFVTKNNAFKITDLEVSVSTIKEFIKYADKELIDINYEISKLVNIKAPIIKGLNYPDATYYDIYNAIYSILFSRYSQLMDAVKIADMVSKYSK